MVRLVLSYQISVLVAIYKVGCVILRHVHIDSLGYCYWSHDNYFGGSASRDLSLEIGRQTHGCAMLPNSDLHTRRVRYESQVDHIHVDFNSHLCCVLQDSDIHSRRVRYESQTTHVHGHSSPHSACVDGSIVACGDVSVADDPCVSVVSESGSTCFDDDNYQYVSQSLPLVAEQLGTSYIQKGNYQPGSQSLPLLFFTMMMLVWARLDL